MVTPNHLLVSIDKILQDEIILSSGIKLYKAAQFEYEWNATISGTVSSSCPLLKDFKQGDEIAFSYLVVSTRSYTNMGKVFHLSSEPNDVFTEWRNGEGMILRKQKTPSHNKWHAILLNKRFDFISHWMDNENGVERWLSQFMFSEDGAIHTNLIEYELKDYWKVNPQFIIAKKNGDTIEMYNNKILLEPIEVDVTKQYEEEENKQRILNGQSRIVLPDAYIKVRYMDRGKVVSGGEKIGLKHGDIVSFEEQYVEKYELWGKKYFIIKESRVLGKWT